MSVDMNSVNVTCRLGKDPDLKYTSSGTAICTLWVAIGMGKDKEGADREATWINVVCFDKAAEAVAQYVAKGDEIGVSGRLQGRSWEDSDGRKRRDMDIVANSFGGIIFLRKKGEGGGQSRPDRAETYAGEAARAAGPSPAAAAPAAEDDNPFGDQ